MTKNNSFPEENKMTETKLGSFPIDWNEKKLSKVFDFNKKPRGLNINDSDDIPFIPMESISEYSKKLKGWTIKKYKEISSGSFVFKGDLLIAKITPCFENGKQAILDNLPSKYGYATTEVWAIHPKNNVVDKEYLFYYLKIPSVRKELAQKMEGTTGRQRLPRHVLENLLISFPPLPEQKKIAGVLSAVQEAKEKTEEVIKAAKELKKSLMKHLFTYGPVSIEEAENVELKETEIGKVPEGWETSIISENCEIITGGTPNTKNKDYWFPHEIYWMKSGEIQGKSIISINTYISKKGLDNSNARWLPKKSVVIALAGRGKTRGTTSPLEIECTCNQSVVCMQPNKNLSYMYLHYCLTNIYSYIRKLTGDKDRSGLNKKIVGNIPLFYPPLEVQKEIATILSSLDKKIEVEENKKKAFEELFKTLLNNLMTGKIRVHDLDIEV